MTDGCEKWDKCVTCPFEKCKYDEKEGADEDTKAKWREYYQKNKERISAQRKERRYKEYQKQYHKDHPDVQYKANKKWKEKNREHVNELQRQYRLRKKEVSNG